MNARWLLPVAIAVVEAAHTAFGQQLLASGRVGGRYDPNNGLALLPLILDWPSTTVWAAFQNSDRVDVYIEAQPGFHAQINTSLEFVLDGNSELVFVASQDLPYTWTRQGLSLDTHELEIVKRTETLYGILVLPNVALAQGGNFTPPKLPPVFLTGRRIMTVGDSIASGWGNIGNTTCKQIDFAGTGLVLDPATEDATQAFGSLVADFFEADRQILAWSGATQNPYPSYDAARLSTVTTPTVPQLFAQMIAGNRTSPVLNFSAWQPQIVLMEGGINDFHTGVDLTTPADWASQYISFIREVQARYDGMPDIIVLSFPKEMAVVGILTDTEAETYRAYYANLALEIERQQIPKAHVLQMDGTDFPVTDYCAAHPNAAAHDFMAQEIIEYITEFIPAFGNSTYPTAIRLTPVQ